MKYIIIIGCGKIGKGIALELSNTENVVAIDRNNKMLDALGDNFNGKKVWGDALDLTILEEAGVKDANAVFLLTGNDNLNIVVGKVVKRKYGVQNVVMQVNDEIKKKIFNEEGITVVNRTYLFVEVLKKCISS